jgi:hypothetical protein
MLIYLFIITILVADVIAESPYSSKIETFLQFSIKFSIITFNAVLQLFYAYGRTVWAKSASTPKSHEHK